MIIDEKRSVVGDNQDAGWGKIDGVLYEEFRFVVMMGDHPSLFFRNSIIPATTESKSFSSHCFRSFV